MVKKKKKVCVGGRKAGLCTLCERREKRQAWPEKGLWARGSRSILLKMCFGFCCSKESLPGTSEPLEDVPKLNPRKAGLESFHGTSPRSHSGRLCEVEAVAVVKIALALGSSGAQGLALLFFSHMTLSKLPVESQFPHL